MKAQTQSPSKRNSAPAVEPKLGLSPQPLSEIETYLAMGQFTAAADAIRQTTQPDLDLNSSLKLCKLRQRLHDQAPVPKIQVAILSSYTANSISQLIELHLSARGVEAECYLAEYGVLQQEIRDPESQLYRLKPRFVLLTPSLDSIGHLAKPGGSREAAKQVIARIADEWLELWGLLHARLDCQIVHDTFVQPAWQALGNHELQDPTSLGGMIRRLNLELADRAPSYVSVHDTDYLASNVGRLEWSDPRFFYIAKLPCAPPNQVDYAHSVASLIGASLGLSKKCLVLDLDNTLWGGVVGDLGMQSLKLGQGDPESEAFTEFQHYLKRLRERGVLLAVCSANEEKIAKQAFEQHPGMVLSLGDISCFVANWGSKATNLNLISKRLELNLDSFVFVDDDPAQRALIRQQLPQVEVPEMPEDASDYIRALDRHRYFQLATYGKEDLERTESYRANQKREEFRETAESVDQFLESLLMRSRVVPIGPMELERSAQLINRSNQFNLTTRRRTVSELESLLRDPSWLSLVVQLSDRFGDNGLISVLLAKQQGSKLSIDSWVMSCRVLRRRVEVHLWNCLVREARRRGVETIEAAYIPTPKNGLVEQHYSRLGLSPEGLNPGGGTLWSYKVSSQDELAPTQIAEECFQ